MNLKLNYILILRNVLLNFTLFISAFLAIAFYLFFISDNSYGAAVKIQAAASNVIQVNFDNVSKINSPKNNKLKHKKQSVLLTVTPGKLKVAYNNIKKKVSIRHKKHKKVYQQKINVRKIKNTALSNSGLLNTGDKVFSNASHIFPMIINKEIIHYIHFYQNTGRGVFKTMLERSERYIPMIKSVFKKLGLPNDLAYLAMVESGFSPTAYSYAGASGMWQFIPSTARIFGLTINWWVDERRNPIESTYAAGEYLKNLFNTFGSWYLAAAAYNSGQMTIERALSLYPGGNFWTISQNKPYLLPGQTRRYVPKIVAAAIIAKDPQNFGFKNLKYKKPIKFAQVKVPFSVSLFALAKCAEISENSLWRLNPDILRGVTPPNDPHFLLNIPADKLQIFKHNFKDIKQYIPQTPKVVAVSYNKPQNSFYYTVQPGDTLDSIALKYGVSLNTLEQDNHLSSYSLINVGEKLLIPGNGSNNLVRPVNLQKKYITVKPGMTLWSIATTYNISLQTIKNINNINNSNIHVGEKIYLTSNYSNNLNADTKFDTKNTNINKKLIEYKVKFGDSLYAIAAKYHSSVKSIMAYNNLKNQNSIYPGQVLKIN